MLEKGGSRVKKNPAVCCHVFRPPALCLVCGTVSGLMAGSEAARKGGGLPNTIQKNASVPDNTPETTK